MQPPVEPEKHEGYAAARCKACLCSTDPDQKNSRVVSDVQATATDAEVYERFKKR